jgi:ArsR family metal-binding transcriptional regulator
MAKVIKDARMRLRLPECNPSSDKLNAVFELDTDIADILPYLNSVLKGFQYNDKEKILVLKKSGRLITIRPREVAITKVQDEGEAKEIFEEIKSVIEETYEERETITPSYAAPPLPTSKDILDLLPKTDCKGCGKQSCRAFAWDLYLRFVNDEPLDPSKCPHLLTPEFGSNYERLRKILGLEG